MHKNCFENVMSSQFHDLDKFRPLSQICLFDKSISIKIVHIMGKYHLNSLQNKFPHIKQMLK